MIPTAKPSRKGDHLRWGESMREDIEGGQTRLIEAALFCYRRFGPPHTRVVDVALQAHVTRVTFYRYFRNGEDLLGATIRRELGKLWRASVEQVPGSVRASEAPIDALLIFLNDIKQPQHLYLAQAETLPALSTCMLDPGYLAATAPAIAPLLREPVPEGGLTTLFELMNRVALTYLHRLNPMFQNEELLRDQLTQCVSPFIASLLAHRGGMPELWPAVDAASNS